MQLLVVSLLVSATYVHGLIRSRLWMGTIKQATFAMGCFWRPHQLLTKVEGVAEVVSGYSGGTNRAPTYKSVCAGDGHLEAVRVSYDASKLQYKDLLKIYFDYWAAETNIPTEGQYSPRIWYDPNPDEGELELIQQMAPTSPSAIAAVISRADPLAEFWSAEGYHQAYEDKQVPRRAALALAIVLDLLPNQPQFVYQAGALLTLGYIGITIGERVLGARVRQL